MKNLLPLLILSAALAAPAHATTHKEAPSVKTAASAPLTTQQNKMTDCSKEGKGKKGDEYRAFMKECLANKPMTQQEKMAACSKQNKGKKGDEYRAAVKECLSA